MNNRVQKDILELLPEKNDSNRYVAMEKYYPQQTLKKKVSFSGIGVHSGKTTTIVINPAPENHGIRFRRIDLPGTPDIQALFKMVVDTSLATVIGNQGAIVSTIEHLMATFSGLGIDNALIEIDAYEMPIMDGSAKAFTALIMDAGIVQQSMPKWFFVVKDPIQLIINDKSVTVHPDNRPKLTCTIEFDHPLIGNQQMTFDPFSDNFQEQISIARTFGFIRDLEYLKLYNLGRGGSLDTAVVLDKDHVLNENGLRFPDEFVRHKLLDCLGDFALLGMPILGHITTVKSGHALNHAFIREFLSKKDAWETQPVRIVSP